MFGRSMSPAKRAVQRMEEVQVVWAPRMMVEEEDEARGRRPCCPSLMGAARGQRMKASRPRSPSGSSRGPFQRRTRWRSRPERVLSCSWAARGSDFPSPSLLRSFLLSFVVCLSALRGQARGLGAVRGFARGLAANAGECESEGEGGWDETACKGRGLWREFDGGQRKMWFDFAATKKKVPISDW